MVPYNTYPFPDTATSQLGRMADPNLFSVHLRRVGSMPKPPTRGGQPACSPLNEQSEVRCHISPLWPVDELVKHTFTMFSGGTASHEFFTVAYSLTEGGEELVCERNCSVVGDLGIGPNTKVIFVTFESISKRKKKNPPPGPSRRSKRSLDGTRKKIAADIKEDKKKKRRVKAAERKAGGKQTAPPGKQPAITGPGHRLKDGREMGARRKGPPTKRPTKSASRGKKMPGRGRPLDSSDRRPFQLADASRENAQAGESATYDGLLAGTGRGESRYSGLFRNELVKARNEATSRAWIYAAESKNYSFKESRVGGTSGGSGCTVVGLFDVSYSRGEVEGRRGGEKESATVKIYKPEEVNLILADWLNLVAHTPFRDRLPTPFLIAHALPDVFWSMVYQFGGDDAGGVEQMMKRACPNMNWDHLERGGRTRVLSLKAQENLTQQLAQGKESKTPAHQVGEMYQKYEAALSKVTTSNQAEEILALATGLAGKDNGGDTVNSALCHSLVAKARVNAQLERLREEGGGGIGRSTAETALMAMNDSTHPGKGPIEWHCVYYLVKSLGLLFGGLTMEDMGSSDEEGDEEGEEGEEGEEEEGEEEEGEEEEGDEIKTDENNNDEDSYEDYSYSYDDIEETCDDNDSDGDREGDDTMGDDNEKRDTIPVKDMFDGLIERLKAKQGTCKGPSLSRMLPLLRRELARAYLLSGISLHLQGIHESALEKYNAIGGALRLLESNDLPSRFCHSWLALMVDVLSAMVVEETKTDGHIRDAWQKLDDRAKGLRQLPAESTDWEKNALKNLQMIIKLRGGRE